MTGFYYTCEASRDSDVTQQLAYRAAHLDRGTPLPTWVAFSNNASKVRQSSRPRLSTLLL